MSFRSGYGQKCAIELYRDATERQAKLAGVTIPTFMCRRCGKRQSVSGRRQVVRGSSRYGYYCASCCTMRPVAAACGNRAS
ncbi:MAG: hypothetical protein QMB75_07485 [Thauera sp.]